MMPQIDAKIIFTELASITNYLNAARDVMAEGHMPDITPLAKRISDMCEILQHLPKQEQKKCLAQLSTLVSQLDNCEKQIKAWKEKNVE